MIEFVFLYFLFCTVLAVVLICSRLLSDKYNRIPKRDRLDWKDCATIVGVAFIPIMNLIAIAALIDVWYESIVK